MKRLWPAKILVTGPDFVGTTAALQHLPQMGYHVSHRDSEAPTVWNFSRARFNALVE